MDKKEDISARIGEAWKTHYAGDNERAVEQFQRLAEEAPDNIDVYWGLGLSYRKVGNTEQATQVFQKVLELAANRLESETDDKERYVMLKRMAGQQISQMKGLLT
ncbi:MAG: tetratricopeptide repeat protein [Anaerolineae bacterium]|jgi:Flp pilus assembly protein TadD|nr:tetratricopeptide repeat protein [Anaerolineae bacterium]